MGIREVMEEFRKRHPVPMGIAPLMREKCANPTPRSRSQLEELISNKGLTLRGFADSVAVAHSSVWAWVHKGVVPRPWIRHRVARFLGVPVSELWPEKKAPTMGLDFGFIYGLIAERGYSIASASDGMGISQQGLRRALREDFRVDAEIIPRAAFFLGISVEELLERRSQ